jgi:hypothetical protein
MQKVGCVHVDYSLGYADPNDPVIVKERIVYNTHSYPLFLQVSQCLPIRIVAWHHCHDHHVIQDSLQQLINPAPNSFVLRCCRHFGNHSEIISKLRTFGIDGNIAPIEEDGTTNVDLHSLFLASLRQREGMIDIDSTVKVAAPISALEIKFPTMAISEGRYVARAQNESLVTNPCVIPSVTRLPSPSPSSTPSNPENDNVLRPTDIVMGRGPHRRSHPGNVLYKRLLSRYSERFRHLNDRAERMWLADEIMRDLDATGARFVHLSGSTNDTVTSLEVVPREKYRVKVTHDIRNLNRKRSSQR